MLSDCDAGSHQVMDFSRGLHQRITNMFDLRPLSAAIGAEISEIDLSAEQPDEVMRALLQVFYESCVVVVRGQDLSLARFQRLGTYFGFAKPHFLDHLLLPGFDSILLLSDIHEDGKPIGIFEGAAFWHTDVAYQDPPNMATVVYAQQVPQSGGRTWFANQYAAYEALPEHTRLFIDKLQVIHHYGNRADMDENSRTSAEKLTPEQKRGIQNVVMPLVRRHPITGRRALYGVAGSSFQIVGMPGDESAALLNELTTHATKPEFVTNHQYGQGDLAAWDDFSTLHKGELLDPVHDRADPRARLLYRLSVVGQSPLL
jgi:taurine dioxygenase